MNPQATTIAVACMGFLLQSKDMLLQTTTSVNPSRHKPTFWCRHPIHQSLSVNTVVQFSMGQERHWILSTSRFHYSNKLHVISYLLLAPTPSRNHSTDFHWNTSMVKQNLSSAPLLNAKVLGQN
jgi:hypothetical protein